MLGCVRPSGCCSFLLPAVLLPPMPPRLPPPPPPEGVAGALRLAGVAAAPERAKEPEGDRAGCWVGPAAAPPAVQSVLAARFVFAPKLV